MTIITTTYRYKRPPRRRKPNPAALAMPTIVHARTPKPGRPPRIVRAGEQPEPAAPAGDERRSAIVTIRNRKHAALAQTPDMTPEEYKRRGDAADALFQKIVCRVR